MFSLGVNSADDFFSNYGETSVTFSAEYLALCSIAALLKKSSMFLDEDLVLISLGFFLILPALGVIGFCSSSIL